MTSNANKDADKNSPEIRQASPAPDAWGELQKLIEAQAAQLAAQQAQIEALLAAQTAPAQGEAGPPAADPVLLAVIDNEARMREKVKVKLFKDNGKYKDDVFVAVNGKSWLIQRGKEVEVPRFVKEILDASMDQDQYAAEVSRQFESEFEAKRDRLE